MIYHCSCAELMEVVPAGSVDIIITDPPYPREYLPCWSELAAFAAHALKPLGSLVALVGHTALPEALRRLDAETALRYNWILSYKMGGVSARLWKRSVIVQWKPLLWYKRRDGIGDGRGMPPFISDFIHSGKYDRTARSHHHWGQKVSGMLAIAQHFRVSAGQVVADPFVGGGSTAIAALALGCDFIGADIDAAAVETTRQRILEYQPVFLGMSSAEDGLSIVMPFDEVASRLWPEEEEETETEE